MFCICSTYMSSFQGDEKLTFRRKTKRSEKFEKFLYTKGWEDYSFCFIKTEGKTLTTTQNSVHWFSLRKLENEASFGARFSLFYFTFFLMKQKFECRQTKCMPRRTYEYPESGKISLFYFTFSEAFLPRFQIFSFKLKRESEQNRMG